MNLEGTDSEESSASHGYLERLDHGGGILGLFASSTEAAVAGFIVSYALGALAGVLFDVDVAWTFAVIGTILGAAMGIWGWWLVRRHGGARDPDPWSGA